MINNFWNDLTSHGSFELLALLALAAVKATLLFGFAALLCLAFRRFSAATRHLLWTCVLCAALLLPFLSFITIWEVPVLPLSLSSLSAFDSNELIVNDEVLVNPQTRAMGGFPVSLKATGNMQKKYDLQTNAEFIENVQPVTNAFEIREQSQRSGTLLTPQIVDSVLIIWIAGVLLFLFRLVIGLTSTKLLTQRASKFNEPKVSELFSSLLNEFNLKKTVRLLHSKRTLMPVVCGIFRPVVLLPADANNWSEERLRMVLLHELAHVARRDCLTQMLAQTACAFYWFNPFVWSAARRLRVEREQACDDYVLSIGTKPSDYAQHLLEIARSMQEERSIFNWSQTTSVAMARQSQLEGRLLSILNEENKSGGAASRALTAGLISLIVLLFVSLAIIRPAVINAQKPHISETASNDEAEKNKTQASLSDSFWTIGSDRKGSTAEIQQTVIKQDSINVPDKSALEQSFTGRQIEKDGEPHMNQNINENLSQSISETVNRQIATNIQSLEMIAPPDLKVNPFINAEYQPERSHQTQNKSEDFIEEMASVGYTNLSIDELIKLKQGDITADYIRNLRTLGFTNLTVKELTSMGIHKVTPAYIQAIRTAGYTNLTAKELTSFRIHNIAPGYIKSLRDSGYDNLNAKQLMDFAVHEVTPSFISGIRSVGFSNLSPKELVSLRIFVITPEFIRKAQSRLGELNIKQLISLKNTGVIEDDKD